MPDDVTDTTNPAGTVHNPESVGNTLSALPEWAQKEIRDLRAESARYRTRSSTKEAELTAERDAHAATKTELQSKIGTSEMDLARYRVAVDSKVAPEKIDSFASRLRGSTPDELAADAAQLIEMFGVNAAPASTRGVDPSQGRGNDQQAPITPASEFAQIMRGQLSGE